MTVLRLPVAVSVHDEVLRVLGDPRIWFTMYVYHYKFLQCSFENPELLPQKRQQFLAKFFACSSVTTVSTVHHH
jgi:hypothetical protein